jgi:hypothetical protein
MANRSLAKRIVSGRGQTAVGSALIICLGLGACLAKKPSQVSHVPAVPGETGRLSLSGVGGKDLRADGEDNRIYVGRQDGRPRRPRLLVRVRGLPPGSKVHWWCDFFPGPLNNVTRPLHNLFSAAAGSAFSDAETCSLADERGEATAEFSGTTYAGDRFQIGWELKQRQRPAAGFRGARPGGIRLTVWKRLYLGPVQVMQNVRFPASVWDRVRRHLAGIHIELVMAGGNAVIDPRRKDLAGLFTAGDDAPGREAGSDLRYGPLIRPWQEQGMVMKDLARRLGGGEPGTIAVVVLGAFSRRHDLIADSGVEPPPPRPADYAHRYSKKELDLEEGSSSGMGSAIGGNGPAAIFIWSDFWWLASQVLRVGHDEALARVILHELGHHLLNALPIPSSAILDESGHILERLGQGKKSIMGGFGPLHSSARRSEERKLIHKPVWHDGVEILIRAGYIPLRQ